MLLALQNWWQQQPDAPRRVDFIVWAQPTEIPDWWLERCERRKREDEECLLLTTS